ncbi:MAG: endonuclease/exonuclease/phosphatase family protein [Actinomycetes bacterium]
MTRLPAPPGHLRVLTWNVRNLLGDPLAVARVLRDASADVACVQEVSRLPGSRRRTAHLARDAGMFFACGGRASAGTALLTSLRADVRAVDARRLRVRGWRTRRRGWAEAVVRLPGTDVVTLCSIHLGLDPLERLVHVTSVLRSRIDVEAPLVVAGDLNEPPGSPSWLCLLEQLRDPGEGTAPTYPGRRPRHRIDAVLVDPRLEVVAYGWPDGVSRDDVLAASDHLPVLAEVVLPPSP